MGGASGAGAGASGAGACVSTGAGAAGASATASSGAGSSEVSSAAPSSATGTPESGSEPLPSRTASARAPRTRLHARMASSLPGMTYVASSGSQFVSTRPITDRPRRFASRTPIASFFRSTITTASGSRCMSATPPRLVSSLVSSPSRARRSRVGSSSSCFSFFWLRSSCRRRMRWEMVPQLVSRPPSQRCETYGMPHRRACSWMESWHCFFVPTKSTVPPRSAMARTTSQACSSRTIVCWRSMM